VGPGGAARGIWWDRAGERVGRENGYGRGARWGSEWDVADPIGPQRLR